MQKLETIALKNPEICKKIGTMKCKNMQKQRKFPLKNPKKAKNRKNLIPKYVKIGKTELKNPKICKK